MSERDELEQIGKENGGVLKPIDIVEYAKNPSTELHSKFTWDNTQAAHEYRLWQARKVIQVYVQVYDEVVEPVRAYVSLIPDRAEKDGGYRSIEDVMSDDDMRRQLLRQALSDAKKWKAKYATLKELRDVFLALDNARKQIGD